jgi:Fumarylacetoacetase N-terminal domain 2
MRLATRNNDAPDGEPIVVANDAGRALAAGPRRPNLLAAFQDWSAAEIDLRALALRPEAGGGRTDRSCDVACAAAPFLAMAGRLRLRGSCRSDASRLRHRSGSEGAAPSCTRISVQGGRCSKRAGQVAVRSLQVLARGGHSIRQDARSGAAEGLPARQLREKCRHHPCCRLSQSPMNRRSVVHRSPIGLSAGAHAPAGAPRSPAATSPTSAWHGWQPVRSARP